MSGSPPGSSRLARQWLIPTRVELVVVSALSGRTADGRITGTDPQTRLGSTRTTSNAVASRRQACDRIGSTVLRVGPAELPLVTGAAIAAASGG